MPGNVDVIDGSEDVWVKLSPRFNPADNSVGRTGGYIGNCVATLDYTTGNDLGDYPVFIDPLFIERGGIDSKYWYVSDAVEYLMATYKGDDYATWPSFDTLEDLLNAQYPSANSQTLVPPLTRRPTSRSAITTRPTSAYRSSSPT